MRLNLLRETENINLDLRLCFTPSTTTTTSTNCSDDIILFEDIFKAEKQPTLDRSIFFIETTCILNCLAALKPR